jgi:hypothetical protein
MTGNWQDAAALTMVALASLWIARGAWRWLRRKGSSGCPSCGGCASDHPPAALVKIDPPVKR